MEAAEFMAQIYKTDGRQGPAVYELAVGGRKLKPICVSSVVKCILISPLDEKAVIKSSFSVGGEDTRKIVPNNMFEIPWNLISVEQQDGHVYCCRATIKTRRFSPIY